MQKKHVGYVLVLILFLVVGFVAFSQLAYEKANLLANGNVDERLSSFENEQFHTLGEIKGWTFGNWGCGNNTSFGMIPGSGWFNRYSLVVNAWNYRGGSCGWYSSGVKIIPGRRYAFKDDYRCDNQSKIIASTIPQNGDIKYYELVSLGPTNNWQSPTTVFTAPPDAYYLSICHELCGNGTLTTDDYRLVLLDEKR